MTQKSWFAIFFPKFVSTQEEKNTVKSKFSCQNSNVENSYLFYDMRHPLCFDEFAIFFFVFGIGTLIFHSALKRENVVHLHKMEISVSQRG